MAAFPRTIGTAARDRAVALRDAINGAGVPSSLDPATVQVPGAWISVRTLDQLTLGDTWSVRFHVYLVAPAVGALEAWDILAGLLDKALTVVEPDETINTATSVALPHTPTQPLPAFQLVVDELVEP